MVFFCSFIFSMVFFAFEMKTIETTEKTHILRTYDLCSGIYSKEEEKKSCTHTPYNVRGVCIIYAICALLYFIWITRVVESKNQWDIGKSWSVLVARVASYKKNIFIHKNYGRIWNVLTCLIFISISRFYTLAINLPLSITVFYQAFSIFIFYFVGFSCSSRVLLWLWLDVFVLFILRLIHFFLFHSFFLFAALNVYTVLNWF